MFKKKLLSLVLAALIGCQSSIVYTNDNPICSESTSNVSVNKVLRGAYIGVAVISLVALACLFIFDGERVASPEDDQELWDACQQGDLDRVKNVVGRIDRRINFITKKDENNKSAQEYACEGNNLEVAQFLIDSCCPPSCLRASSLLYAACHSENADIFKYIVNDKIEDINDSRPGSNFGPSSYATPLAIACKMGRLDFVRWLVEEKNADIMARGGMLGRPIQYACIGGHQAVVDYFVTEKDLNYNNIEQKDESQQQRIAQIKNLVVTACRGGNLDIVKLLVNEKGFRYDFNFALKGGYGPVMNKPLYTALQNGKVEVAKWLVDQKGIRIVIPDTTLRQANITELLHEMYKYKRDVDIAVVEFFIEHGADREQCKHALLKAACCKGDLVLFTELAQTCDENDLNHTYKDKNNTLLHYACAKKHKDIVKYLLEKRVDVKRKNKWKQSPFLLACHNGGLDCVKLLVEEGGADINEKGCMGLSPLKDYHTDKKIKKYLQEKVKENEL